MTTRRIGARRWRLAFVCSAAALVVSTAACHRGSAPSPEDERIEIELPPKPIPVHVRNENFLDVNVFVVVSGVSRRLGMVTGNAQADFVIDWNVANGQTIIITATPIGGRGTASSGSLTVGRGQMIDFKVGSTLRQSTASVHDPH